VPPAQGVPVFASLSERAAARVAMEVIGRYELQRDLVPSSSSLLEPHVQQRILAEVQTRWVPTQASLLPDVAPVDLARVVAKTAEVVVKQTIDIPRITVVPKGEVTTGFKPFTVDVSQLHLQPGEREIVGQMLRTSEQFTVEAESGFAAARPEDYIVHSLVDFDDVDYFSHSELLYDLAGQVVRHLRSYLQESEVLNVLDRYRRHIAKEVHAQMAAHFVEHATEFDVRVSRGFTELRPSVFTLGPGQAVRNVRDSVEDPGRIKQMVFGGFQHCLYPVQKFDSGTERRLALILERAAVRWFKPAKGQFQIYYKLGPEESEYVPDFVAETSDALLMIETKARDEMQSREVLEKADAAVLWCVRASNYCKSVDRAPWKYLLVPHDAVNEAARLVDLMRFEKTCH
jgi:type III restriction enzyme